MCPVLANLVRELDRVVPSLDAPLAGPVQPRRGEPQPAQNSRRETCAALLAPSHQGPGYGETPDPRAGSREIAPFCAALTAVVPAVPLRHERPMVIGRKRATGLI